MPLANAVSPESAGLDLRVLADLVEDVEKTGINVHAVLVARHRQLAFERYFTGPDEHWGQPLGTVAFGPEVRHDLRSVTKSLTGLVFGVAIERGWIGGVDEPVFHFFPELADLKTSEKDGILLRHLLTMSPGLAWDEERPYTDPENSEIRMTLAADPYRFASSRSSSTRRGNAGGTVAARRRCSPRSWSAPRERSSTR